MKKITALFIAILLIASIVTVIPVNAAEEFSYVHITASGNDPYATFTFSPDGNQDYIDPDTVTWAVVKYRTITETDNTGVQLIGQFYITPAAEPFVPVQYNHTGNWEIIVVDLTTVSEKATVASAWNSQKYTATSTIRFDPLESNRDAEAAHNEEDDAVVSDGDSIDIAFIAFFDNEEDAKAYDGTQNTPYCQLMPEDLEWYADGHNIGDIEYIEGKKPHVDTTAAATTEKEPDTEPATDAPATDAPATDAPASDNVTTAAPDNTTEAGDSAATPDNAPEDGKTSKFPGWAIALIAVAAVVLIAAIITGVISKKKKK